MNASTCKSNLKSTKSLENISDSPPTKTRRISKDSEINQFGEKKILNNDDVASNLLSPLKRIKIDKESNLSDNKSTTIRNKHFIDSVEEVCYRRVLDIQHRINVTQIPECCLNSTKYSKNVNTLYALPSEQEALRINIKNDMLSEALDLYHDLLIMGKLFTPEMLQTIITIILNVHGNNEKNYLTPFILHGYYNIFQRFLSSHPPYSHSLKTLYNRFLLTPCRWNDPFDYNEKYEMESELLNYLIKRFQKELALDSPDGPINKDKLNIRIHEISLDQAHSIKNKFEIHTNLHRANRIKRLFMTLQLVLDVLESDFAIWISNYPYSTAKMLKGKKKPLIALIIWEMEGLQPGSISDICSDIFKLFVDLIKLEFPQRNIETFSRLVNLVCNVFYCCDENPHYLFSNIGSISITLAEHIFNILKGEDIIVFLTVVNKLKTKYMQYLLSSMALKTLVDSKENFVDVVMNILKERKWLKYPTCKFTYTQGKSKLKSNFSLEYLNTSLNSDETQTKNSNSNYTYKHLDIKKKILIHLKDQNINSCQFSLLFFYSLKYYLEFHDVESIQIFVKKGLGESYSQHHEVYENSIITIMNDVFVVNEVQNKLNLNKNVRHDNVFKLSRECVYFYKNVFKDVSSIVSELRSIKSQCPHIYSLFCNINALKLF